MINIFTFFCYNPIEVVLMSKINGVNDKKPTFQQLIHLVRHHLKMKLKTLSLCSHLKQFFCIN
jgi:hypothetical protein